MRPKKLVIVYGTSWDAGDIGYALSLKNWIVAVMRDEATEEQVEKAFCHLVFDGYPVDPELLRDEHAVHVTLRPSISPAPRVASPLHRTSIYEMVRLACVRKRGPKPMKKEAA